MELTKTMSRYEHKLRNELKLKSKYRWKTKIKSENRKYNEKDGKMTENIKQKNWNKQND